MLNKFFLLIATLFLSVITLAQEARTIKGKVTDANTLTGISFVNIGIEGTLIGTASNTDGEFTLKIPSTMLDKNLYFSAIGYQNLIVPATEIEDDITISLHELTYGIEDIEISTQSKVLYRIIRDAAYNSRETFLKGPFNYTSLYQNELYTNKELDKKRDALILIYDRSGYATPENAYKNRTYKVKNVHRNFDVKRLADGTTLMDDLLAFDIVRSTGNILQTQYLENYDLQRIGDELINNDSVVVIGYKLEQPDFHLTGDYNASFCEGKLYISKHKKVVVKSELHIKAEQQSPLGRNIATHAEHACQDIDYHVTTFYKETGQNYALDKINLNLSYSTNGKEILENASLQVIDVKTNNPQKIKQRQYFEDMISDPDFWLGIKSSQAIENR